MVIDEQKGDGEGMRDRIRPTCRQRLSKRGMKRKNTSSLKMEFGWVYLCLSITLGGCSAQLPTSSEEPGGSTLSGFPLVSTASTTLLPENRTLMAPSATLPSEGNNTEASPVDDNSTSTSLGTNSSAIPTNPSSTTGMNTTVSIPVVVTEAKKKNSAHEDSISPGEDQSWDDPFKYDYVSLRHAGLAVASVLFLMGILIIASSRMSRFPKCRRRSGKTYQVTRVRGEEGHAV
ncbi:hypothetical protein GJAV_G00005020 [Gymnothorax javanicus]|nr:hypothetical protein GJAV_G00005020 [Gymnothorax javanicus]